MKTKLLALGLVPLLGLAQPTGGSIEHGRYLAQAAGCAACHTRPRGATLAGGAALHTPFGAFYGPNLTPDDGTGLGRWTQADFTRALRQGRRPDGTPLYPAMPYENYTKMSDGDIADLWAFLRSLPPVHHVEPVNKLRFPFNLRRGVALWQDLYFKDARFDVDPGKNAEWNRGAYLVEALGHCGACHTPRNLLQGLQQDRPLSGAQVEGWYAPPLTRENSRLIAGPIDALQNYLKTGRARGNVKSFGPMEEVVNVSLSHLTDADILAISVYLHDAPPPKAPQPHDEPAPPLPPAELAAGRALFDTQCASCHQPDGRGATAAVPALAGNAAITAHEASNAVTAILDGFAPEQTWGAMPAFASLLNDGQVALLANYVRNAWGNQGGKPATADEVAGLRASAVPASTEQKSALMCPLLPSERMQAAQRAGDASAYRSAAADAAQRRRLEQAYRQARPHAGGAEVIEALSAAYCRVVAETGASASRTGASVIGFSQLLARDIGAGH